MATPARRGTPNIGLAGELFVVFLQNHDQIANSATGRAARFPDEPRRVARIDLF